MYKGQVMDHALLTTLLERLLRRLLARSALFSAGRRRVSFGHTLHRFLLGNSASARPFSGARIRLGTLAVNGQVPAMA